MHVRSGRTKTACMTLPILPFIENVRSINVKGVIMVNRKSGFISPFHDTEPLDESGMLTAKEWLLKNFGNEKTCNNAAIVSNGDRSKRASKSSKSSRK